LPAIVERFKANILCKKELWSSTK